MNTCTVHRAAGLVAAASILAPAALADLESPDLEALARTLDEARLTLDVPGMGVAIVHEGEVVFARGFGERTLGGGEEVDADTLFAIGSSSKAFTSAGVAMLVDEGEVNWNDRVREHLPWFRMHDPYPTDELRIYDMLAHTSGLPRGDMLWYGSDYTRREVVERLPELEPFASFRSAFGYQNIMYVAAGLLIEEVSGTPWDEFIPTRIFEPLGMDDTNLSVTALSGLDNVATPHAKIEGDTTPVPWRNIDNAAPAGSINSSVNDMARWVTLLLNKGRLGEGDEEEVLITPGAIEVMWTPVSLAVAPGPAGALRAESHFLLYGLGWFLQDYRGEKVVQHGGNIDGMSALVAMLPEHDLGVVVLTNMNGSVLPPVAVNEVFDAYLGADDHDWADEAKQIIDTAEQAAEQAREQAEENRVEGTSPSHELEDYTGTYSHDFYGDIEVALEDGALVFSRGSLVADAAHWHYDTFELTNRAPWPELGNVSFRLAGDGKVAELVAFGEDEWFKEPEERTADESIVLDEAQMRRYTGTYLHEGLGIQVNVFIQDGELRAQIPGQPSFEMLPTGEHEFALGGLPPQITVDLTFVFNDDGSIKALSFTQTPGGTFELLPQEN